MQHAHSAGPWRGSPYPESTPDVAPPRKPTPPTPARSAVILGLALAMGLAQYLLFQGAAPGVNLSIAMVALGTASTFGFGRQRPSAPALAALVALVITAIAFAIHASEWTAFFGVVTAAWLLTILPILSSERTSFAELGMIPIRVLARILYLVDGVLDVVGITRSATSGPMLSRLRGVIVGALVGAPITLIFGGLLSEDPAFSSLMGSILSRVGDGLRLVIWSALGGMTWLVVHAVHAATARAKNAAPAVALETSPYRVGGAEVGPRTGVEIFPTVSPVTWGTVLSMILSMFLLFVVANARSLFAGHAAVRSAGSTTYASYLHAGFAQLVFATLLSVAVVVVGHLLMGRDERGAVRGGPWIKAIEIVLLALTGLTVASCWQRLAIYEEAYGATYLRLFVAVVLTGAIGLLSVVSVKSSIRHWRGFASGVLALGALLGVATAAFDADGYIASTNLDRAARGSALDIEYLRSLSSDACVANDHPFLATGLATGNADIEELRQGWSRPRADGWRSWRGMRSCR